MTIRFLPRRLDQLVYLPVLVLLIAMWAVTVLYTQTERQGVLERAQTQLNITVATLADANELALTAAKIGADQKRDSGAAIVSRALQQYPTARIWIETDGTVTL